jgi:putative metallohydrolase (TIGR04338 family)
MITYWNTKTPRDFQRQKVYDAEKTVEKETCVFWSVQEMQEYVNRCLKSSFFQNNFSVKSIEIKDGRGRRRPCCQYVIPSVYCIIKMPKFCRNELILIHEITHATLSDADVSSHGAEYCRNYLLLVKEFISEPTYNKLVDAFKERNVSFSL